jgi:transcriptional regulator with XRE-family HTH domain
VHTVSLATNVRHYRLAKFWSQTDLAAVAGIHRATIARIELGDYVPMLKTIRALATALGVEPAELVSVEELERAGEAAAGRSPAAASSR